MEFNFELRRILILLACLLGFPLIGGFAPPKPSKDSIQNEGRLQKAWFYCVTAFVVGAVSVSVVDHQVGTMDSSSLRPAYIVLGVILMIIGALWIHSLKSAAEGNKKQGVGQFCPFSENVC